MRVGVDASASTTSSCLFFVLAMVALDGVFLLVVHSGELHRSNKLAGVALTEATRDVVVVGWWRCVVVGWRRCLQTLLIGMNVKNYDELRGRVVEGGSCNVVRNMWQMATWQNFDGCVVSSSGGGVVSDKNCVVAWWRGSCNVVRNMRRRCDVAEF